MRKWKKNIKNPLKLVSVLTSYMICVIYYSTCRFDNHRGWKCWKRLLDKRITFILDGDWLSDSLIDAAQSLLKNQFPSMCGLQPTVLGETLAFNVVKGDFVQVILVNRNHWVTVSNIRCQRNCIDIYDSKPSIGFPSDGKEKIAALICSDRKQFNINFKPVQRQKGGQDCGLFAIAFAHSICCGIDPTGLIFLQVST